MYKFILRIARKDSTEDLSLNSRLAILYGVSLASVRQLLKMYEVDR